MAQFGAPVSRPARLVARPEHAGQRPALQAGIETLELIDVLPAR